MKNACENCAYKNQCERQSEDVIACEFKAVWIQMICDPLRGKAGRK